MKGWKKVRSGRRILGYFKVAGMIYLWKSKTSGDSGVSGTREQAVNNIVRAAGLSRRQYEITEES